MDHSYTIFPRDNLETNFNCKRYSMSVVTAQTVMIFIIIIICIALISQIDVLNDRAVDDASLKSESYFDTSLK